MYAVDVPRSRAHAVSALAGEELRLTFIKRVHKNLAPALAFLKKKKKEKKREREREREKKDLLDILDYIKGLHDALIAHAHLSSLSLFF